MTALGPSGTVASFLQGRSCFCWFNLMLQRHTFRLTGIFKLPIAYDCMCTPAAFDWQWAPM